MTAMYFYFHALHAGLAFFQPITLRRVHTMGMEEALDRCNNEDSGIGAQHSALADIIDVSATWDDEFPCHMLLST